MASLVTHADKRQPKDFLSRTLMALFLLKILENSDYIPSSDVNEGKLCIIFILVIPSNKGCMQTLLQERMTSALS